MAGKGAGDSSLPSRAAKQAKEVAPHRHRYFFTPRDERPKHIRWKISGKRTPREVTTRHTVRRRLPDGSKHKIQSGLKPHSKECLALWVAHHAPGNFLLETGKGSRIERNCCRFWSEAWPYLYDGLRSFSVLLSRVQGAAAARN